MRPLLEFVLKARGEGKTADAIAEEANASGLRASKNRLVTKGNVYSMISEARRKGVMERSNNPRRRGPGRPKQKAEMITFPVPESVERSSRKMIAMVGEFEDVEKLFEKFMRG
jgi:hypothetical protein